MLGDVVALQPFKRRYRVIQAGGGHAPGTNGSAHQVHRLAGLRQPLAKDETVQRTEDQPFGAARCGGDDPDVLGLETVLADMDQRFGACMNVQRFHVFQRLRPCSLAKALAMALLATGVEVYPPPPR